MRDLYETQRVMRQMRRQAMARGVMAVLGKAGSGKTLLLAELTRALIAAGRVRVAERDGAVLGVLVAPVGVTS